MALGGALGPGLVARDVAALCVAGVAQSHIHLGFAWQAWQAWHSWHWVAVLGLVLRGRPGINVAGVAQSHIHLGFAWQAWHSWHWAAPLGPVKSRVTPRYFAWHAWHLVTSTFVSRGRRGTNSHPPWFCVAGVALMALGGALGPDLVARDAAALCVAGVALGDIHLRFTWQAWHLLTFTLVLRGRRGTSFHVAGVAQSHIHLRFEWQVWQTWHSWHWVARLGPVQSRRVTPRHFAWQAWHLVTSTFVSRGRRGIFSHSPWFCVAGVAFMALGGAL